MSAIEIDWTGLSHSFESGSAETHFYLDRQTGRVVAVAEEALRYAETSPYVPMPEWMQNAAWEAAQVRDECGTRYIPIPQADTADEYHDMEAFISTVANARLQSELWRAIRGTGAFRRFRDCLVNHPTERQHWLAFKDARMLARMNDWLAGVGVEPANPRVPPGMSGADGEDGANPDAERQELIEELALLLLYAGC